MKLRMQNGSVRLRLSPEEVRAFGDVGVLEESVYFGAGEKQRFVYRIEVGVGSSTIAADIDHNAITISIPPATAAEWVVSQQVSLEAGQGIGDGRYLNILIEKDFARLRPRSNEDVEEKFPHPRAPE
ncbi:MAG: hypothetical protein ABJA02_04695 [Acidobacteriota bacterium]